MRPRRRARKGSRVMLRRMWGFSSGRKPAWLLRHREGVRLTYPSEYELIAAEAAATCPEALQTESTFPVELEHLFRPGYLERITPEPIQPVMQARHPALFLGLLITPPWIPEHDEIPKAPPGRPARNDRCTHQASGNGPSIVELFHLPPDF